MCAVGGDECSYCLMMQGLMKFETDNLSYICRSLPHMMLALVIVYMHVLGTCLKKYMPFQLRTFQDECMFGPGSINGGSTCAG